MRHICVCVLGHDKPRQLHGWWLWMQADLAWLPPCWQLPATRTQRHPLLSASLTCTLRAGAFSNRLLMSCECSALLLLFFTSYICITVMLSTLRCGPCTRAATLK